MHQIITKLNEIEDYGLILRQFQRTLLEIVGPILFEEF